MILAILALAPAVQAYSDPLQMLTYNCNGLQKYSEKALGLLNLIKTVMPHVLILTETWQTAKDELKLPIDWASFPGFRFSIHQHYQIFTAKPARVTRGVALLVHKTLTVAHEIQVRPCPETDGRVVAVNHDSPTLLVVPDRWT